MLGFSVFVLTLGQSLLGGISIDIQSGPLKQLDKSLERYWDGTLNELLSDPLFVFSKDRTWQILSQGIVHKLRHFITHQSLTRPMLFS